MKFFIERDSLYRHILTITMKLEFAPRFIRWRQKLISFLSVQTY